MAALRLHRERQDTERAYWAEAYEDHDLVFAREDGKPVRPEWVLDNGHALAKEAGLRRIRLHGLRHLAIREGSSRDRSATAVPICHCR